MLLAERQWILENDDLIWLLQIGYTTIPFYGMWSEDEPWEHFFQNNQIEGILKNSLNDMQVIKDGKNLKLDVDEVKLGHKTHCNAEHKAIVSNATWNARMATLIKY